MLNSTPNGNQSWVVLSSIEQSIKQKIESLGVQLKEWNVNIYRGLLTGLNEAFIIDEEKRNELIATSPEAETIIRPILLGKDLKRYEHRWQNTWLINSHNGIKNRGIDPINLGDDYPALFDYLQQFLPLIEIRSDQGKHWSNLRNCAYIEQFELPKIAWANLATSAQFTYVEEPFLINNPSNFFNTNNLYLLAALNSTPVDFYIQQLSVARSGGYIEYKPMFVEKVPIPRIEKREELRIGEIVKEILAAKRSKINTLDLERQIEDFFVKVYSLTDDELTTLRHYRNTSI